ncbi:MAG: hypothetical protein ABJB40_10340 [Acidobacteriota bacterium]
MTKLKVGVILALFLSPVALSGCGGKSENAVPAVNAANNVGENSNSARTNVEELGLLINVPYEAEDVVWKEASSHKKLTVVFRFSAADAGKLVAEAERAGAPQNVSVEVETWFPDELTAQSEISGDSTVKGRAYPANAFYQEPYTSGKITRIEDTNYFLLELTAK